VVSDHFFGGRRATVCLLSTLLMTLSLVFGYYAVSVAAVIIGFALTGLTLYGPDSLLSGAGAADVADDKASAVAAAGIINGIGSLGPIVQEQVVPWLLERDNPALGSHALPPGSAVNLQSVNLLFGILSVVALAALFYLYRRAKRSPQHAF
jgi:sugar phosphate permease